MSATNVRVPLHQHEYDAFLSLAYNIGLGAFCGSTPWPTPEARPEPPASGPTTR